MKVRFWRHFLKVVCSCRGLSATFTLRKHEGKRGWAEGYGEIPDGMGVGWGLNTLREGGVTEGGGGTWTWSRSSERQNLGAGSAPFGWKKKGGGERSTSN